VWCMHVCVSVCVSVCILKAVAALDLFMKLLEAAGRRVCEPLATGEDTIKMALCFFGKLSPTPVHCSTAITAVSDQRALFAGPKNWRHHHPQFDN